MSRVRIFLEIIADPPEQEVEGWESMSEDERQTYCWQVASENMIAWYESGELNE